MEAGLLRFELSVVLILSLAVAGCAAPAAQQQAANNPPAISISSPSSGAEVAGLISVTGAAEDVDSGGTIVSVEVKVDTGIWRPATGTSAWSFPLNTSTLTPGAHTIYARASDGQLLSAPASVTVTLLSTPTDDDAPSTTPSPPSPGSALSNRPPTVSAGPSITSKVGEPLSFAGTASDPDGDTLTYEWDFGDGSPKASTLTPIHTYQAAGTFTVTLSVGDGTDTARATTVATITYAPTLSWKISTDTGIRQVAISPNGQYIVASNSTKDQSPASVLVYRRDGTLLWSEELDDSPPPDEMFPLMYVEAPRGLAVSDQGQVSVFTNNQHLHIYDASGNRIKEVTLEDDGWEGFASTSDLVATSADGSKIIVGDGYTLFSFDGAGVQQWKQRIGNLIKGVAMTNDGKLVAVGGADEYFSLYSGAGASLAEKKLDSSVEAVAISHDGRAIAALVGEYDSTMVLFKRDLTILNEDAGSGWRVALSNDGTTLAVTSGEDLRLFDFNSDSLWDFEARNSIRDVALSADGNLVVIGADDGFTYLLVNPA